MLFGKASCSLNAIQIFILKYRVTEFGPQKWERLSIFNKKDVIGGF